MTVIVHAQVTPLLLPLVAPFAVATRTAYEARNILLRVHSDDGREGIGLSAPVEYVTGETVDTVVGALSGMSPALTDLPVERLSPLLRLAAEMIPDQPAARTALEMALLDLWAKTWRIPLWHYFGASEQMLISDMTIPIVSPECAGERAQDAIASGFRHLKIKVGDPLGVDADYARLAAVAHAAPDCALRIDANQAFTPDAAVEFARKALAIAPRIELIEQPVRKEDIEGLAYVRENLHGLPLFADESAQSVAGVAELIRRKAVDGVNIKLMKSGIAGAWQIASLCHAHGIKLMIGCMLESSLSLTAAVALVSGTGWFDHVDLDSQHLLAPTPLFTGGMTVDGARLLPDSSTPGWGVGVDVETWNNFARPRVP